MKGHNVNDVTSRVCFLLVLIVPGEGLRPEEIPDPQKAFSLEDILREAPQSFGRTNIRSENNFFFF